MPSTSKMDGVSGASAVASLVILGAKLAVQAQTFICKVKNASEDVRHISSDLESIVKVLGRLEGALKEPTRRNVFNAMNGSDDFLSVTGELMAVFKRFEMLMKKYDRVEESRMQKARWGWGGEGEALALGRTLTTHKSTLVLTLQLTNALALSSVGEELSANLVQTRGNTEDILHQMRLLSATQPARDTAVLQWLEQAASYAGSTIGIEDAEEMPRTSFDTPRPKSSSSNRFHLFPQASSGNILQIPVIAHGIHDVSDHRLETKNATQQPVDGPEESGEIGEIDTIETVEAAYKLGCLYVNTQNWASAEAPVTRALAGYLRLYGPQHLSTVYAAVNLGTIRRHQNRPSDAEKLYLEALRDMEALHADTSHTVYNIALLYHEQGSLQEAVDWYCRAVEGLTKSNGAKYQHTIAAHSGLASIYEKLGRVSEAEKHYKLALGG